MIWEKVASKTSSGDKWGSRLVGCYILVVKHILLICYAVGGTTTLSTSIVLMGIDFAINIFVSIRIVWIKRRTPEDVEKQIYLLQELAINEMVEFMAPLAFVLAFVIAYYGPNSNLIGNVGATIWQFVAVEDISHTMELMCMLFLIDFSSTVISGIILWVFCKINLAKVFMVLEKEYGLVFCIVLSVNVLNVSN